MWGDREFEPANPGATNTKSGKELIYSVKCKYKRKFVTNYIQTNQITK